MKHYDDYKDSGLPWLGQVPAHWEVRKITRAFANLGSGTTPEAGLDKYYQNGTIPWVNTGDLNDDVLETCNKAVTELALRDYSALKVHPAGTILVAMYGATIGKTSLLNFDACLNQACCALTVGPLLNEKFAFFYFLANKQHIISLGYGGGQPNISQDTIKQLRIPVPPLPEQRAIAAYLDRKTGELDQLLRQKEALRRALQQQRQALINEAVTQGLDADAPRRASGVEWLGEVPAHWEITQLKHVTDFVNGAAFKPEAWVEEGIPIVRIQNLNGNQNFNCISPKAEVKKSCHLHGGELLFSWSGNVGTSFGPFLWKREGLSYLNQHIFKLENYYLHQKYFYWLLKAVTKYIEGKTHGIIGMVHVTKPELGGVGIPKLTYQEQAAIADYLDQKMEQLDTVDAALDQQLKALAAYRQALVAEVVTGKVDVRGQDAPITTETAAPVVAGQLGLF